MIRRGSAQKCKQLLSVRETAVVGLRTENCHLTGKYRGAGHNVCNLRMRKKSKNTYVVPVSLHNMRTYNGHFIIRDVKTGQEVSRNLNNTDKYISFSIDNLRFIDSYFLIHGRIARKICYEFKNVQFCTHERYNPTDILHLLLRKGVFLYEYVDGRIDSKKRCHR